MTRPLTQLDLATIGCATPNCTHDHTRIFLAPKCHPHGKVEAMYDKAKGTIAIRCAKCSAAVTEIAVAAAPALVQ